MTRRWEAHAWKRQQQDNDYSLVSTFQHENGKIQLTICKDVRPYLSVTQSSRVDALVDCEPEVRPIE